MRLALGLAYDGSAFPGWQTQPAGDAVQDHVERSLSALAGHPVATVCAGRTDAGVHALNQVVHLDTDASRPHNAWVRGVNARLPGTVSVQWARAVPDDFHARFHARSRTYRYLIRCAEAPHPLWRERAGWVFRALDVDAMREAAAALLGEHDFTSFRSAQCQAATPVRTLSRLAIERRGDFVVLELVANAFLHHMVRNVVGALVWVGTGRRPPGWMGELLAARRRALGAPTFSAAGLYLAGVEYDPGLALPSEPLDPFAPAAAAPTDEPTPR
ncbi:MAG TPA: tRNA pseudouridine(38-40) synthase TruA [Burkholderiaceae bacterium]|nr:tRNA pseudouridine(38-40) synthase TruA [Burkholderiaceae bacterium]